MKKLVEELDKILHEEAPKTSEEYADKKKMAQLENLRFWRDFFSISKNS